MQAHSARGFDVSPTQLEDTYPDKYDTYRAQTDIREPYRIPRTYLHSTKPYVGPEFPEAPLIVFINGRSGGRVGSALSRILYHTLGFSQVFELHEHQPREVLKQIWQNLDDATAQGDQQAAIYQRSLRVLAAGGDGTVAWILGVIQELGLQPPPPVAVLPLGTGNDLALSFGWGNTFLKKWLRSYTSIYHLLRRIADAEERDLDIWSISLTSSVPDCFTQLPYSLRAAPGTSAKVEPPVAAQVSGHFWNYFSIGVDAEAAHRFHHLRDAHPCAAPNPLLNQAWYAYYGCASGWFCLPPPVSAIMRVQVAKKDGSGMQELKLPANVKALVVLNLQSYGGGRDLFGIKADSQKLAKKGFEPPIFDDGQLEVLGLRGGFHTGLVLGNLARGKLHARRLAQTTEIIIHLQGSSPVGGERGVAYMQMDGEPWSQPIPSTSDDLPLTVHIKHGGISKMLCNTEVLKGMPPRVRRLAERGAEFSQTTPRPSLAPDGSLPSPSTSPSSASSPNGAVHHRRRTSSVNPVEPGAGFPVTVQ